MSADIELQAFDTGRIECHDFRLFSPAAAPGQRRTMSVRSYLVRHPDGVLLWDTGIDDAIAAEPGGRQIAPAIRFHVDRPLRSQLTTPIDVLALSHLHVDHVGNLDLFPEARVLLQRDELDAAHGPDAEALTYVPASYADLVLGNVVAVDGGHDVFGDGTVLLVPLPGHTPGHQGLLVTLARSGPC